MGPTPLEEAQDPLTSPARLAALAQEEDPFIQSAVTQNPNTSAALLLQLGERYPREFLSNPALPILLLENPSFWETLPEDAALALLSAGPLPREALFAFTRRKNVMIKSVLAKQNNVDILRLLAEDKSDVVRRLIAENPGTPADILRLLAEDKEVTVRIGVAGTPNIPVELFRIFSRDKHHWIRSYVLLHPKAPPEIRQSLHKNKRNRRSDKEP